MIEVSNLSKHYGAKKAVDNISFTVEKGEILGLLGPNGAGKTTTMNIITGYISSTSGNVTVNGFNVLDEPLKTKKSIGYLPEHPPLYNDMTVDEYLSFVYDLKKVKLSKSKHIDEIKEMVKISSVSGRLIKNLSKGYKQRVGLAQALIGDPEVLILDEPTVGLDPKQIIEMRDVIKGLKKTIILSSHILPEISAVCEKIIIINNGKIVATGTTDDLSHAIVNENRFTTCIRGDKTRVLDCFRKIEGMVYANSKETSEEDVFEYTIEGNRDIREDLFFALAEAKFPILSLSPFNLSLEEIFIKITTNGDNLILKEESNTKVREGEE